MNGMLDLFDCDPPRHLRSAGDLTAFMCLMRPVIDDAIKNLRRATFVKDPICGQFYSHLNSVLSSAQKRHGRILEIALREGLQESGTHQVWTEPKFKISLAADMLFGSQTLDACCRSELQYGEEKRSVQIDLGLFNITTRHIGSYELKRANGLHDAGKLRSMRRDLGCTRMLLKDYGRHRGFDPQHADSIIIFYYGRRSIPAPYSLIGDELDDHFSFPIIERIEAANAYYKEQLHELLSAITGFRPIPIEVLE